MNLLLVVVSFLLYAAAFPKFNAWGLSFIALIPFFAVLDQARSLFRQVAYGMLWGGGMAVCMGYWLFPTLVHHYEVPFFRSLFFFLLCLVLPLALLYGAFALIYRFLFEDRIFFHGLVVPSLWVLVEYVKTAIPFLVPWGGLDIALVPFSSFVQAADIIGGYGLVFVAVVVNTLCLRCIRSGRRHVRKRSPFRLPVRECLSLFYCLFLVAAMAVYGMYRAGSIEDGMNGGRESRQKITATVVQGNFSTKERWSGMGFYHRTMTYLEMSRSKGEGLRIIVWPETVLNSSREVNDALFSELMQAIGVNSLLISGGLHADPVTDDISNCIYFISGDGCLSRYDKQHLLPYAETSPFFNLLNAYYSAPSEFRPGRTPTVVPTLAGMAGASICMEILYPDFIRRSVKNGAAYLVNVSNDSWFGDSAMPYIHLCAARLRAIENRRYVLRASNSGISAVISPTGRMVAQTRLFTKERVDAEFIRMTEKSVYTRCGDIILYGAVLVLMAALLRLVFRKN